MAVALSLKRTRAAKGTNREEDKEQRDGDGNGNQPVGHVPGPGTKGGIQPGKRQNRENGADSFVEKLFQHAPKPLESARFRQAGRQ